MATSINKYKIAAPTKTKFDIFYPPQSIIECNLHKYFLLFFSLLHDEIISFDLFTKITSEKLIYLTPFLGQILFIGHISHFGFTDWQIWWPCSLIT